MIRMTAEIREALMSDWLAPHDAAKGAGVSYGWIRQLGKDGKVDTLPTPLGLLYNRGDVERIARERAAKITRRG